MARPGGEPPAHWHAAQRWLHWAIAILVVAALPMGLWMTQVPLRQMLLKYSLYQAHKSLGIAVFLLALAQMAMHVLRGRPRPEDDMPRWQVRSSRVVHGVLFALLVAIPLLGYVTAATAPARIPTLVLGVVPVPHLLETDPATYRLARQVHHALALVLAGLVGMHVVAAVAHHLAGRRVLTRMLRG